MKNKQPLPKDLVDMKDVRIFDSPHGKFTVIITKEERQQIEEFYRNLSNITPTQLMDCLKGTPIVLIEATPFTDYEEVKPLQLPEHKDDGK